MGYFKNPCILSANTFSHFCNSNKTIGFLLSFSLLPLILSLSSFLPFLLHSFHIHISSTFPFKPFTYAIDKNYMFLLCNGLLAFIVKNSGLVGNNSSSGDDLEECVMMKNGDSRPPELEISENKALDESKDALPEVEEEEERANGTLLALGKDQENDGLILTIQDEEEDEEQDNGLVIIEEEEEEEGNGFELLSTEELNKRCDDFIRKMKEEIKFGGQQLIVV